MNKFRNVKSMLKNRKGGLGKILTSIFLVVLVVYIFTSAIHPTANAIKGQGQSAGQKIMEERSNIDADFVPVDLSM